MTPWVSVNSLNDAVNLGTLKKGLRYQPSIVTNDFTPFFQCLCPLVENLLTVLGSNTWSETDLIPNYKVIRDILLERFGTVEGVSDWSPRKDVSGYGLLKSGKKRKLPPYATDEYMAGSSQTVCTRYC